MSASENAARTPPHRPMQFTLRQVGIAVLVLCVVLALFVQWGNNLKQIAIALHNYHDDYGCFPPPYVADASGKPMHSWRVLLLPYIEERSLYELYDFSEPWNGPNNRRLAGEIPAAYRCTDLPRGLTFDTAYLAIVGPGTAWRTDQPTTLSDIQDGLRNTLMVVEVHESGVNWLEPRDWAAGTMPLPVSQLPQPKYRRYRHSHHFYEPGNWAVFADGYIQLLPSDMPPAKFQALTTIAGSD